MTDADTSTPAGGLVTAGGITVVALDTPTLGDRCYLVHDAEVAFVVDPSATSTASPTSSRATKCG